MTIRIHFTILLFFICFFKLSYAASFLEPLDGPKIPFEQLKGKWVLINFWASWCEPCLAEIKTLNHFYKKHQDQVQLFAVNVDDASEQEQLQLAKHFRLIYPSLLASATYSFIGQHSISAVPATFVFSPQGTFKTVHYGQLTDATLKQLTQEFH